MPAPSKNLAQMGDQDVGFKGMLSRLDAAMIPSGFVSRAINRRFESGKVRNRWGVVRPVWGGRWVRTTRMVNVTPNSVVHQRTTGEPIPALKQFVSDPATNETVFASGARVMVDNNGALLTSINSFDFTGPHTFGFYDHTAPLEQPCGILAYRDADTGSESLLVAVNEARLEGDGGQGKVYVLRSGQSHLSILSGGAETIDMHGHDFYAPVRLIRTSSAVVMLRPGPPRYYFRGTEIDATAETIELHVVPDFATGTKVQIARVVDAGVKPPVIGDVLDNTYYFARVLGKKISLYITRGLAEAGSTLPGGGMVNLSASLAASRYYVMVAESANWWSQVQPAAGDQASSATEEIVNDGLPLIMQANEDESNPLDAGFDRFPNSLIVEPVVTANTDKSTITVINHRFVPADRVFVGEIAYYVHPVDSETLHLYDGQTGEEAALAGTDDYIKHVASPDPTDPNEQNFANFAGDNVHKSGASGAPVPAAREGIYFGNRLVIVYGFDHIAVSDVLDPLHYLPLISEFKLNTGTNDPIVCLYPFNQTTILVFKERSILAIENIFGDLSSVRLVEITREFGCLAARTVVSTGADVVFLSQRGVVSMKQTEFGMQQSVVLPLSEPIQDVIDDISQARVSTACASYWDNRYILSVPHETGDGKNDLSLVYNFLNSAWDGIWRGEHLKPIEFERLDVNGTLRLVWIDSSGYVHYFTSDAMVDPGGEIETELRFRAYTCGMPDHKQWTEVKLTLASFNPDMTIRAVLDGVEEALPLATNWARDRTAYLNFGMPFYETLNSNDDFLAPYRQDYSLKPGFQLKSGVKLSLHQQSSYRMPMRQTGATLQPVLITSQGSVEIYAMKVLAVPARLSGQLDT